MPVISRFYGMVIKMYFLASEHNPPHIPVIYGEYMGDLPSKALALVREWTMKNKDALLEMWKTQDIRQLPPIE